MIAKIYAIHFPRGTNRRQQDASAGQMQYETLMRSSVGKPMLLKHFTHDRPTVTRGRSVICAYPGMNLEAGDFIFPGRGFELRARSGDQLHMIRQWAKVVGLGDIRYGEIPEAEGLSYGGPVPVEGSGARSGMSARSVHPLLP
jgi:hypothetical protein